MNIISKIEFSCLFIPFFKNMSRTLYWLSEPQMIPDYFVNSFVNDMNKFSSIFKQCLPSSLSTFCLDSQDFLCNKCFIDQLSSMNQNSVNILGVNLLLRNYNKIYTSCFDSENFPDSFKKRIDYYPNYIRLLTLNEEALQTKLKEYFKISSFSEQFIEPLLSIKTNVNKKFLNEDKKNIFAFILK